MKAIGNLLWFVLTGLVSGLSWALLGVVWCITIIGIPFGKQCFKMACLSFFPFGKQVNMCFEKHPIANILWLVLGGLELAAGFAVAGVVWCITIVGIPFGKQCFKLAKLALFPVGADVIG